MKTKILTTIGIILLLIAAIGFSVTVHDVVRAIRLDRSSSGMFSGSTVYDIIFFSAFLNACFLIAGIALTYRHLKRTGPLVVFLGIGSLMLLLGLSQGFR